MGARRYRRLFLIATEGSKTEPQYFALLNEEVVLVQLQVVKGGHASAPQHVANRLETHLRKVSLRAGDEAWLVIDKDQWTDPQLMALHVWTQGHANRFLALSNPMFEYWLLLHFEGGDGVGSAQECTQRLRQHLPYYDKGIAQAQISREQVEQAIVRARRRDQPPCADWPRSAGGTTVYRLVENILMADE